MKAVSAMLELESMLRWHGAYTAPVAWEMDQGSADALTRASGAKPAPPVPGIEAQCLGIPVTIVERPGIRLVFTVTER